MQTAIIISGPSGVGKSTVAKALQARYPNLLASVTHTTRAVRAGSVEDKKIYYVSTEEFETGIANNEFLEWARVHGQYYGTHKAETLKLLETNPVIFTIDVQGMQQLVSTFPPDKVLTIFLLPESKNQIIDHIRKRGHIEPADFAARMESAEKELAKQNDFQYKIVNNEGKLPETINKIAEIIEPYLVTADALDKKADLR